MNTIAKCIVQEEGLAFAIGLLALFLVLIVVGILIVVLGLRAYYKATRERPQASHDGEDSKIVFSKEGGIKIHGAEAKVVTILVGIGLVVIIPLLAWYSYGYYSNKYLVGLSSPIVEHPLEELRVRYSRNTNSPVVLSERAREFFVSGTFQKRRCVSDLFMAICDKYERDLNCTASWTRGTTIR